MRRFLFVFFQNRYSSGCIEQTSRADIAVFLGNVLVENVSPGWVAGVMSMDSDRQSSCVWTRRAAVLVGEQGVGHIEERKLKKSPHDICCIRHVSMPDRFLVFSNNYGFYALATISID